MNKYTHMLAGAIVMAVILGIAGCASHVESIDEAQAKIGAVEKKLDQTQDQKVQAASEFVTATGVALEYVSEQSPAVTQAKDLNNLAESALTSAGYAVSTQREQELADTVRKLVDANAKLVKEGQREKAKMVSDLAKLEAKTVKLETELDKTRAKFAQTAKESATIADEFNQSWFGGKARRLLTWGGIVSVLGVGGIIALCFFVPPAIPFVIGIFGRIAGWIVGLFPKLISMFGVVGKSVLEGVWEGAESFKAKIASGEKKTYTQEEVLALFRGSMNEGQDYQDKQVLKALEATYTPEEIAKLKETK
jgi:hypothetical protein